MKQLKWVFVLFLIMCLCSKWGESEARKWESPNYTPAAIAAFEELEELVGKWVDG